MKRVVKMKNRLSLEQQDMLAEELQEKIRLFVGSAELGNSLFQI